MRRRLTIAEAARRLEITESKTRALLKDVEPSGYGKWQAELYDEHEVVTIGRRLRLGHYRRESRRILVVAPGEELGEQLTALVAAGLDVRRTPTVLEALSEHSELGMPILVVATTISDQEYNVLATVVADTYSILIGSGDRVPETILRRAVLMDHDELRKLVRRCWELVEIRIDQVNLRL